VVDHFDGGNIGPFPVQRENQRAEAFRIARPAEEPLDHERAEQSQHRQDEEHGEPCVFMDLFRRLCEPYSEQLQLHHQRVKQRRRDRGHAADADRQHDDQAAFTPASLPEAHRPQNAPAVNPQKYSFPP